MKKPKLPKYLPCILDSSCNLVWFDVKKIIKHNVWARKIKKEKV